MAITARLRWRMACCKRQSYTRFGGPSKQSGRPGAARKCQHHCWSAVLKHEIIALKISAFAK